MPVPLGDGVCPPPIFLRAFRGGAKGSRSSYGVVFSLLDVRPDRSGVFLNVSDEGAMSMVLGRVRQELSAMVLFQANRPIADSL